MPLTQGFKEFVAELLTELGPVTIRNMFSGAGVYADGVMFALIADDVLYLKTDAATARAFAAEGTAPFTYKVAGKTPVAMSYWEVPPRLLEEEGELAIWARQALEVARASKSTASKNRRRGGN